jgi:nucleoside-diphosphate-sugar epimerase
MQILITGANGFVGSALCAEAVSRGLDVRGITRVSSDLPIGVENIAVGCIDGNTDWQDMLAGYDVVVHLAARVHVMQEVSVNPLAEFRRINVEGALNLARNAVAAGVERFVYVSSVKVNGEVTQIEYPFTAEDEPTPRDSYAISKMEAEQGLREIAHQTGIEVVIIRPPLVYGPGVKANFAAMIRFLMRGAPLPLGAIHNQRSLVSIDNLVDLILICIKHPEAANETFMVSDDEDLSTTELLRRLGHAMDCPVRLIPVPVYLLKLAAAIVGKRDVAQRLCGSLQVDIEKTRRLLGWKPPISLDEGLKRTVRNSS